MAPSLAFCAKKESLTKEFTHAVSEFLRMQSAQVAAVLNGDSPRFEQQLADAVERKDQAKLALIAHQTEHGC